MDSFSLDFLRTFVTLARQQSVGDTTKVLGATRQTVARHIKLLQAATGGSLFENQGHRRILTAHGEDVYEVAAQVVDTAEAILKISNGERPVGVGRQSLSLVDEEMVLFVQDHPLNWVWRQDHGFLGAAAEAWVSARFELGADAFRALMPFVVILRRMESDWIVSHVGEKSSIAFWHGPDIVLNAVGKPAGYGMEEKPPWFFFTRNYERLNSHGGAALDHVYRQLPRKGSEAIPVSYQRLLLACYYPDGSPAIASIVHRTRAVEIEALDASEFPPMAAELEEIATGF